MEGCAAENVFAVGRKAGEWDELWQQVQTEVPANKSPPSVPVARVLTLPERLETGGQSSDGRCGIVVQIIKGGMEAEK